MRFFLEFSYAGTQYHGWQRQTNAISVQEVMETALETLIKTPISLVAAGRTDTGVHARQMFAHFDAEMESRALQNLVYQLNQFLPQDIAIHSLKQVQPEAHARFDALYRTYKYHIVKEKTPFGNEFHYFIKTPLDLQAMKEGAKLLLDYEDFECFSKSHTDVKTFLCKISHAEWTNSEKGCTFTITANRFLRNMVRAIVGTLVEIGLKKKSVNDLHNIIMNKNRSEAGYSVPAQGLFLTKVEYPKSVFL